MKRRRAAFWIGALFLINLLLIGGIVLIARNQPPDTLLDSGGCAGCWQGIQPGVTSPRTAFNILPRKLPDVILNIDGYIQIGDIWVAPEIWVAPLDFSGNLATKRDAPLYQLCLTGELSLGRILTDFGVPDQVRFLPFGSDYVAVLRFDSRHAIAELWFPVQAQMTFDTEINRLCFWPQLPFRSPLGFDWAGIAPLSHYYPPTPGL